MTKKWLNLLMIFVTATFVSAQTPQTTNDDVVKITSSLVQIDAIVINDKDGLVNDLTAEDFEVFQDGKPQKITGFSFVNKAVENSKSLNASGVKNKKDKNEIAPPPTNSGVKNDEKRVVTFIVDDGNCMSLVSLENARKGLLRFVDEQMSPGDTVAIYRTRGGSSLLPQYTSDKEQMRQTIRKLRWYPEIGCSAAGDLFETVLDNSKPPMARAGGTTNAASFETESDRAARIRIGAAGEAYKTVGTFGVVDYIVRGMNRIPGRKSILFLSDGFGINNSTDIRDTSATRAREALRQLIDRATRASVVFYTIDTRGVFVPGLIEARDQVIANVNTIGPGSDNIEDIKAQRSERADGLEDGMRFLADESGGRYYKGADATTKGIQKALDKEIGYYLLAYEPEEGTFKGKEFHKIEVKLKRPNLRVRSRKGFFGTTEIEKSKPKNADSELYEALVSPILTNSLDVRLSTLLNNTPNGDNFLRVWLHLDGKNIKFADDPKLGKKAVFDVVAVTLDEKNKVSDEFNTTNTLSFPAQNVTGIVRNGLIFSADIPVKKPGVYSFRIAVRDSLGKRIGAASQTVEIPNLKKEQMLISGLSIGEATKENNGKLAEFVIEKTANGFSLPTSDAVPAIRRFRRGQILSYNYKTYNAKLGSDGKPNLTKQVRLYREGNLVFDSQPQTAEIESQKDIKRILDYGYLRLNPNMQTGDYSLQLIIKDTLSNRTTAQYVDFEVSE